LSRIEHRGRNEGPTRKVSGTQALLSKKDRERKANRAMVKLLSVNEGGKYGRGRAQAESA